MKKILFGLFSVFICNVALADVKVVNDISDKTKIDWEAVDAAVPALNLDVMRQLMYEYFIENEGQEISPKEILSYCLDREAVLIEQKMIESGVVKCGEFVKKYITYIGGDATDCTMASSIIGKDFSAGGYKINATTFGNAMTSCAEAEGGGDASYADGTRDKANSSSFQNDSWIGTCFRFIRHVKKCTRHLESYYTKELLKTDLDAKKKKQYSCILNLVQTGQLELPMNLMKKKCK